MTARDRIAIKKDGRAHWPVFGIPEQLHMDNGQEFHSTAFLHGCDRYDINVRCRPPGTPRFGGAIERLIGTMMKRVRLLPGATYSEILKGRPPKAEQQAFLTLEDVELYLANEIIRYHHTVHSSLGVTPLTSWERAWRDGGKALLFFGQGSRQHAIRHFMARYHAERNHQGSETDSCSPTPPLPYPITPFNGANASVGCSTTTTAQQPDECRFLDSSRSACAQ